MSDLFSHYKPCGLGKISYQWVLYDNEMPDEVLRGFMGEVEAVTFDRKAERTVVGFYSTPKYSYELLEKVREWEKKHAEPIRAARRERQAAESRARFEEYFSTLGLESEPADRPSW